MESGSEMDDKILDIEKQSNTNVNKNVLDSESNPNNQASIDDLEIYVLHSFNGGLRQFRRNEGDTIILKIPKVGNGHTFGIIDCVNPDSARMCLEEIGATKLDFIVVTHNHKDHYEGVTNLLEGLEDNFAKGTEYWCSDLYREGLLYEKHLSGLAKKIQHGVCLCSGMKIKIENAEFKVLSPPIIDDEVDFYDPDLDYINYNNSSVVILIEYGDSSVLLAADAQYASQKYMIEKWGDDLEAHALKVPHHGHYQEYWDKFLDVVKPKYIIISSKVPTYIGIERYVIKKYGEDIENTVFNTSKFCEEEPGTNYLITCKYKKPDKDCPVTVHSLGKGYVLEEK